MNKTVNSFYNNSVDSITSFNAYNPNSRFHKKHKRNASMNNTIYKK